MPIQQARAPSPAAAPPVAAPAAGSTASEADPTTSIASKVQVPNQRSAADLITKARGGNKLFDAGGKPIVPGKAVLPGKAAKLAVPGQQPANPGQAKAGTPPLVPPKQQPPKTGAQPIKPGQQPAKPGAQPTKPGQQPRVVLPPNFGKPLGAPAANPIASRAQLPNAPALSRQQAAVKQV
jgi:hypothetical protein